jgi:hypothetical protein
VDPLLRRIEAHSDSLEVSGVQVSTYTVTLVVAGNSERAILMQVVGDTVTVPEANLIPGWSATSETFRAVQSAVAAVHRARTAVGGSQPRLMDVAGGWDVGIGNIVLSDAGRPTCVSHGELARIDGNLVECAECGARALFS